MIIQSNIERVQNFVRYYVILPWLLMEDDDSSNGSVKPDGFLRDSAVNRRMLFTFQEHSQKFVKLRNVTYDLIVVIHST